MPTCGNRRSPEPTAQSSRCDPLPRSQTSGRGCRRSWAHGAAALALCACLLRCASGAVLDPDYDCQLREIARDYTREVVLASWAPGRAPSALALVEDGLRLATDCNAVSSHGAAPPGAGRGANARTAPRVGGSARGGAPGASKASLPRPARGLQRAPAVELHVSTTGSDTASGTEADPLRTVAGAQGLIRRRFPDVATRPAVTVFVGEGDYFYGSAGPGHLANATGHSTSAVATFTEADSGSSASSPVTYTTHPASARPARLIGGVALDGLLWAPAGGGLPSGVVKATVPGDVKFDAQDQLFVVGSGGAIRPLVRARTPNGKPWVPMDGFNLTVLSSVGTLATPAVASQCATKRPPGPPPGPPPPPHPTPAPGQCVAIEANTSLLGGYPNIPGVSIASHSCESAADCMAICHNDSCCHGFTWHDASTGSYYKQCYVLRNPDADPMATAYRQAGHFSGLCDHSTVRPPPDCKLATRPACAKAVVVCDATNVTQVSGVIGTGTAAGRQLAGPDGVVRVKQCLEHLLDLANDWPAWNAASYGLAQPCAAPSACVNTLDTSYNYPLWFGPWAGGIVADASQDTGAANLSSYSWTDGAQVTVHAMADGEWGGVQFRVSSAAKPPGSSNPTLTFSMGGFQQARGAVLSGRNRFYMEGSIEFLDSPGEWVFVPKTRELVVYPPRGVSLGDGGNQVVLTQTDTLLRFLGSSSDAGSRVANIVVANLTFALTSAQFFRPHEETSGGDYATHRSGAVKIENATGLTFIGNEFWWIGGNAMFLSASVRDVVVTQNLFRFLGTSGVAVQGKTGAALMDGRDGETMMAAHGPSADNGVRLPKNNTVSHNIFADYGVWDKQSACFHKALAPGNLFLNNVCFNSSRHGVNFQDGMGGGGVAEGNLMFNLNRETSDTTAFNSWNRRNYITSDPADPAVGVLVPATHNEWRRNLVLARDFFGIRDGNGNALRNDDGASYYTHTGNVLYAEHSNPGVQFNGGTQIFTRDNLMLLTSAGWNLGPTPDVMGMFNDTIVDPRSGTFTGRCNGFWGPPPRPGVKPGVYTGDYNTIVVNSTGRDQKPSVDPALAFCGSSLAQWQNHTGGQDAHSSVCNSPEGTECSSRALLARARAMMWAGQ